jgi:molybdopterin-containing oxidoreductase family membrane subunit
MSSEFKFDSKEEFLEKLDEVVKSGVKPNAITTLTPFHIHEAEHILKSKPSDLRFFTLVGAMAGFFLSFIFIIYTVLDWPLITGGKSLVSIPAFIIIAFECTILIGGIVSLLGFLHLNRLPNIKRVIEPRECGSQFIIIYNSAAGGKKKMRS